MPASQFMNPLLRSEIMNETYYPIIEKEYFSYVRMDMISMQPLQPGQKVLEIGAAGGNTLLVK